MTDYINKHNHTESESQKDTFMQHGETTCQQKQAKALPTFTPFQQEPNCHEFSPLDGSKPTLQRDVVQQSLPHNVLKPQYRFTVNHTASDNAASDLARFLAKS